MDQRQGPIWPHGIAERADVAQSDTVVDGIARRAAAAAELQDRQSDGPGVHGSDDPGAVRGCRSAHRRIGEMALRALEEVPGPGERGHHAGEALCRLAAVQRVRQLGPGGFGGLRQAAELKHFRAQRQDDLVQAGLACRPAQVGQRLAHLEGIAGSASQNLVHVGDQGRSRQVRAVRHGDDACRQVARLVQLGREGAASGLHVHDQPVEASGELLRKN